MMPKCLRRHHANSRRVPQGVERKKPREGECALPRWPPTSEWGVAHDRLFRRCDRGQGEVLVAADAMATYYEPLIEVYYIKKKDS